MKINLQQMRTFAEGAPREMAQYCLDQLEQMADDDALACLNLARDALEHDRLSAPDDVELSTRVELARAYYGERLRRTGVARESYSLLCGWSEEFWPFNVDHVGAILSGLEWAIEFLPSEVERFRSASFRAVAQIEVPSRQRQLWLDRLSSLRARMSNEEPRSYRLDDDSGGAEALGLEAGLTELGWQHDEEEPELVVIGSSTTARPDEGVYVARMFNSINTVAENVWGTDLVAVRDGVQRLADDYAAIRSLTRTDVKVDPKRFNQMIPLWRLDRVSLRALRGLLEFWAERTYDQVGDERRDSLRSLGSLCLALGYMEAFTLARRELRVGRFPPDTFIRAVGDAHLVALELLAASATSMG